MTDRKLPYNAAPLLEPDRYGERRVNLYSVQFKYRAVPSQVWGHFLIAAATEKEAKWFLEDDMRGVFDYGRVAPWSLYVDKDWNQVVQASDNTYTVTVTNTTPEGILSRYRGIIFKTYVW